MMQKQFLLYLLIATFLSSCNDKPADEDIKRKIVLDYACPETVLVSAMQITGVKETTSFIGSKEYEYSVSGEVFWKDGCNEFGSSLTAGYREKFENKKVILIKGDEGWR
jgi:hypothetical protein